MYRLKDLLEVLRWEQSISVYRCILPGLNLMYKYALSPDRPCTPISSFSGSFMNTFKGSFVVQPGVFLYILWFCGDYWSGHWRLLPELSLNFHKQVLLLLSLFKVRWMMIRDRKDCVLPRAHLYDFPQYRSPRGEFLYVSFLTVMLGKCCFQQVALFSRKEIHNWGFWEILNTW